ncbi:RNA polymerase II C-terminal domain kinase beta subunit [Dimargaris cristalligena]|nr:RNA polymerase II C-terminal domain kinase beta subunit [Dimargaris cristalligena]
MEVSITCLFVACKAEETIKKLRDIILAVYVVVHPTEDYLSVKEHELEQIRRRVILCESALLEVLHFYFEFPHPHKYLIKFSKCLQVDKELASRAWKIVSDCFQTNLPLQFPPHTVAAGALYLASKMADQPLVRAQEQHVVDRRPWFVKLGSRLEDIDRFSNYMIDFYIANSKKSSSSMSKQVSAH